MGLKHLARVGLPLWLGLVATMSNAQAVRPGPEEAEPVIAAGLDVGHDTYRYHIDNPSRFNTPGNVPHYFEQDYHVDAVWLRGRARYRAAGRTWVTEAAVAPSANGVGRDYDTFFNPDGNLIVYGTTADTSAFSFRVSHTVELGAVRGFRARVGYTYRRDRAEFHDSLSVTTMTRPPTRSEFWNTGRESTISEVHEIRFGLSRHIGVTDRWRARLVADVSPATLARLTTLLPDKYPGDPIVFVAKAAVLEAAAEIHYQRGRAFYGLSASYSGSAAYSASHAFSSHGVRLGVHVGIPGR